MAAVGPYSYGTSDVEDAHLQRAVVGASRCSADLQAEAAKIHDESLSLEERLKALEMARVQLLADMKEKLPDGYDPMSFDQQDKRLNAIYEANVPTEEQKAAEAAKRTPVGPMPSLAMPSPDLTKARVSTSTAAKLSSQRGPTKFQPAARPTRTQGVEDSIAYGHGSGSLLEKAGVNAQSAAKPQLRSPRRGVPPTGGSSTSNRATTRSSAKSPPPSPVKSLKVKTSPPVKTRGLGDAAVQISKKNDALANGHGLGDAASQQSNKLKSQKLQVTIVKAAGLKHLNLFGDAQFCKCEVQSPKCFADAGQPGASCVTSTVGGTMSGTLDPVWNETHELSCQMGDSLLFTISDKGLIGSSTEGKVTVRSEDFQKSGFQGDLPISGLEHATLTVKIELVPEVKAEAKASTASATKSGLVSPSASIPRRAPSPPVRASGTTTISSPRLGLGSKPGTVDAKPKRVASSSPARSRAAAFGQTVGASRWR